LSISLSQLLEEIGAQYSRRVACVKTAYRFMNQLVRSGKLRNPTLYPLEVNVRVGFNFTIPSTFNNCMALCMKYHRDQEHCRAECEILSRALVEYDSLRNVVVGDIPVFRSETPDFVSAFRRYGCNVTEIHRQRLNVDHVHVMCSTPFGFKKCLEDFLR